MNDFTDLDAWLRAEHAPVAVYFADADCVEYVAEDTTCVYDRVDGFLTLIFDETKIIPIGFKLKGFRNVFEKLKAELGFSESEFVELVKVLETACTQMGEARFGADTRRRQQYEAARKLARNVKLYDFPIAA